jgi:hypothetical protein
MRLIDRFDEYMMFKKLNDNKATIQLGFSVGTIGKSRGEGRDLSKKAVQRILAVYNDLDERWLKTGEGEMFNQSLNDEFEALCERRNFNPQERKLMKSFMNLPKEERTAFMKLVDYLVDGILLEPDQKITEEELNRRVAAYEERLRTHLQADEDK